MDGTADVPNGQNDPFGDDFFVVPYLDELRVRAQQVRQDNQDAIHHYVELVLWGMRDRPDLMKLQVALFWLWEDIETKWLAEACSMSVRNICEVAEAESPVAFNCLDCGRELPFIDRQHQIDRLRSYKAVLTGDNQVPPRALLCVGCIKRRDKDDSRQRAVDQKRHRAMLRDYRMGSYEGRRAKEEWKMLKKEVHSRDDYRCRMCGGNDCPLHVHHRTYRTYAEERLEDLITLCADCHGLFHSYRKVS